MLLAKPHNFAVNTWCQQTFVNATKHILFQFPKTWWKHPISQPQRYKIVSRKSICYKTRLQTFRAAVSGCVSVEQDDCQSAVLSLARLLHGRRGDRQKVRCPLGPDADLWEQIGLTDGLWCWKVTLQIRSAGMLLLVAKGWLRLCIFLDYSGIKRTVRKLI